MSARDDRTFHLAVLPGDGIGPEVTGQALRVLRVAFDGAGVELDSREYMFGGSAVDETGVPFPPETRDGCLSAGAVLIGAVGGSQWDHLDPARRPERGLLELRKAAGAFANLRPVIGRHPGVDLLVVRELTSGIYYGPSRRYKEGGENVAESVMRYSESEIRRVSRVAFETARRRHNHVTSVDKANVLEVSRLWREVVTTVHQEEYPDVTLSHAYVDSMAMRVVREPEAFDVILTGNLFGDILSDLAGTLAGSLGMLPSSCIGGRPPIYEPVHGSAPDIAGTGRANPIGAILSGAMLLEDAGLAAEAAKVRGAVTATVGAGYTTDDIAESGEGRPTVEVGDRIIEYLAEERIAVRS